MRCTIFNDWSYYFINSASHVVITIIISNNGVILIVQVLHNIIIFTEIEILGIFNVLARSIVTWSW